MKIINKISCLNDNKPYFAVIFQKTYTESSGWGDDYQISGLNIIEFKDEEELTEWVQDDGDKPMYSIVKILPVKKEIIINLKEVE